MNITEMLIQMQRQISYLNGRLKQERNMEADTDKFRYVQLRPRLLTTGKCVGGEEPFYASMSIVIPDLNSTVKWSAKTVIFSMSFLTRVSSNPVMSVSCPEMKS